MPNIYDGYSGEKFWGGEQQTPRQGGGGVVQQVGNIASEVAGGIDKFNQGRRDAEIDLLSLEKLKQEQKNLKTDADNKSKMADLDWRIKEHTRTQGLEDEQEKRDKESTIQKMVQGGYFDPSMTNDGRMSMLQETPGVTTDVMIEVSQMMEDILGNRGKRGTNRKAGVEITGLEEGNKLKVQNTRGKSLANDKLGLENKLLNQKVKATSQEISNRRVERSEEDAENASITKKSRAERSKLIVTGTEKDLADYDNQLVLESNDKAARFMNDNDLTSADPSTIRYMQGMVKGLDGVSVVVLKDQNGKVREAFIESASVEKENKRVINKNKTSFDLLREAQSGGY